LPSFGLNVGAASTCSTINPVKTRRNKKKLSLL
jgi:hypothetical protein